MTGIFGAVGCPRSGFEHLATAYQTAWTADGCETTITNTGAMGGHAPGERRALHRYRSLTVAECGGLRSNDATTRQIDAATDSIVSFTDDFLSLHPRFTGNAAVLEPESGHLHLAADWSGAFPLYYARWEGGLVFASLLRPLVRVTEADVDPLGLIQYLRRGYVFGERTLFRGIRRLRPGEVLRFRPERGRLERRDRSQLWVGETVQEHTDALRRCGEHLVRAVRTALEQAVEPALMMSGGWDSRTLLAAACIAAGEEDAPSLLGYSHGDIDSRELTLVRRLCGEAGVPCHLEPIDEKALDPSSLARDFARTGTANFPHWHQSAHVLADLGVDYAIAGVFGEVLGGHYGRTMAAPGWRKVPALLRTWLSSEDDRDEADAAATAWRVLRLEPGGELRHWYLDKDFDHSVPGKRERINEEIRSALHRLRARGIRRPTRLVEACISEHRGSQYIAGQTVSLRTAVDVALPFADRELLHLASRIPAERKAHNAVNRGLLERLESPLLDHPMAATLVPASVPVPLQEATRAIRKLWETVGWRSYFASGRRIGPPRLSWVNFEFLRDGRSLHDLVDDLRADIWDREALQERIVAVRSGQYDQSLHPLFDQLGQVVTVDLLLQ